MKKIFVIMSFYLAYSSSLQAAALHSSLTLDRNTKEITFDLSDLKKISENVSIPYGNKSILENHFPLDRWFFSGINLTNEDELSDSDMEDRLKYKDKWQEIMDYREFNYADSPAATLEILNHHKLAFKTIINLINQKEGFYKGSFNAIKFVALKYHKTPIIQLPRHHQFNVFGISFEEQEASDFYATSPLFLVLDDKGNFISAYSSYTGCAYVDCFTKQTYIDSNYIFHTKYFLHDDYINVQHQYYEKHQITPSGQFVRYYDNDGDYESDKEKGLVENHRRTGAWLDMKYNPIMNSYTIIESTLPIVRVSP